jgi:hypothetical protein
MPAKRLSFTVPDPYDTAFRRFAEQYCGGNKSAAFRALMDAHSVTKSLLALSGEAT